MAKNYVNDQRLQKQKQIVCLTESSVNQLVISLNMVDLYNQLEWFCFPKQVFLFYAHHHRENKEARMKVDMPLPDAVKMVTHHR